MLIVTLQILYGPVISSRSFSLASLTERKPFIGGSETTTFIYIQM